MNVRIKICCISSREEASIAVAAGASAVGLVSRMPSGPGVIEESLISRVAATVPPGVSAFLLTCLQDSAAIIAQQRRCGAGVLQLCDAVSPVQRRLVRESLPGIKLVQVVHVRGDSSIAESVEAAVDADALLLDSGRVDAAVKELGGTGRVHNWEISARIVSAVRPTPVWLAGGLNSGNVAEAIRIVRPFGVDVCNGVRTKGHLDPAKLHAFFAAVAGCLHT